MSSFAKLFLYLSTLLWFLLASVVVVGLFSISFVSSTNVNLIMSLLFLLVALVNFQLLKKIVKKNLMFIILSTLSVLVSAVLLSGSIFRVFVENMTVFG